MSTITGGGIMANTSDSEAIGEFQIREAVCHTRKHRDHIPAPDPIIMTGHTMTTIDVRGQTDGTMKGQTIVRAGETIATTGITAQVRLTAALRHQDGVRKIPMSRPIEAIHALQLGL